MKYHRIIGLQIRRLRDKNGMTQKELAEYLHVSKSIVSSWETYRTEPDNASIVHIAKLFHVTTDYLLIGNQNEIP
ncbi:MAG: helix-turn-helix transcriptional regulator [Oscillospiraceae bacterium]|jgi:transcriptional regulator with XRE-family HTH domain|nr:helix-turn-helix transcriptional regulator [Oscillospiraceae bacterium]